MGTVSTAKLAGISLILGPIITLVCYFTQQLGVFADAEWGNSGSWAVAAGGAAPTIVATSIIVSLSLLMLAYGILFIADEIRGNGNGDALARYGTPLILIGLTGWVLGSGIAVAAATQTYPAAVASGAWLALSGINSISGIFFSLGFAAIFFAMASRDEYNSTLANLAGLIALVAFVLSIIGFSGDASLAELMTQIVGVTYLIHSLYAIYIGWGLYNRK